MRQGIMLLLGLCSLAAAMVPSERKAIHNEKHPKTSEATKTNGTGQDICEKRTPCAWTFSDASIRETITNTDCICGSQSKCRITEEYDDSNQTYIHRCRSILNDTTTKKSS